MHITGLPLPDDGAPDASVCPLPQVDDRAGVFHAVMADLLDLTVHMLVWGGTQAVAGHTVRDYLVHECRLPGWLAGQLEAVAMRLPAVPQVAARFDAGVLSFDQLAGFVRATSSRNGEVLTWLDEEAASLADLLDEQSRTGGWLGEVQLLVDDLRAPGHVDRAERRAERGEEVIIGQDLDGGGFILSRLGKAGFTTAVTAIDAAADPDQSSRRRARAAALLRICEESLAGTTEAGTRRPARPTMVVSVDLADATTDRFGQLLRVAAGHDMPALSSRLCEAIAGSAELIVQVREGRRPLLELAAADTAAVPAPVRRAVRRRDRACRWPGCTAPVSMVQVHHIVWRSHGGTDDPDNLLCLCAFHHLRHVHRLGWTPHLDPVSGLVTWTRPGNRTIASMPGGHRPPPRRDPQLLRDWLAPPRPPPPDHLEPPGPDLPPGHWSPRPDD